MRKWGYGLLGVGFVLAAFATDAFATVTPVPEISPSAISAGLALLAGGVLLVRARMHR